MYIVSSAATLKILSDQCPIPLLLIEVDMYNVLLYFPYYVILHN